MLPGNPLTRPTLKDLTGVGLRILGSFENHLKVPIELAWGRAGLVGENPGDGALCWSLPDDRLPLVASFHVLQESLSLTFHSPS